MASAHITRRAAFRTFGIGVAAGAIGGGMAIMATPSPAADIDPVYALIAAHKASYARLNEIDSDDPQWKAINDADWLAWDALCDCQPTTMGGVAAMALYVGSHADRADLSIDLGPTIAFNSIAEAVAAMEGRGPA